MEKRGDNLSIVAKSLAVLLQTLPDGDDHDNFIRTALKCLEKDPNRRRFLALRGIIRNIKARAKDNQVVGDHSAPPTKDLPPIGAGEAGGTICGQADDVLTALGCFERNLKPLTRLNHAVKKQCFTSSKELPDMDYNEDEGVGGNIHAAKDSVLDNKKLKPSDSLHAGKAFPKASNALTDQSKSTTGGVQLRTIPCFVVPVFHCHKQKTVGS